MIDRATMTTRTPYTTLLLCAAVALMVPSVSVVYGQGGPSRLSIPSGNRKKELSEAAEKLRQAKENLDLEKAKQAAESVAEKLPSNITDAAKSTLQSPDNRGQMIDAAKSAAETLLPEARKLLKKEGDVDSATNSATAPTQEEAAEQGPKPMPLQPIVTASASAPAVAAAPASTGSGARKPSVIIEADEAAFDSKAAIIIYTGHVRARHPQFYLECAELEVHMVKDKLSDDKKEKDNSSPRPKAKAASIKDPVLAKDATKSSPQDSGIEMAIARGPMVTIEKLSENGDIQLGKCKKAVYRSATGQIVMSNYPQVQRGNILHIADQPDTLMTFDPNGKLTTTGHTRTVILQGDDAKPATTSRPGDFVPAGSGTSTSNDQ